MVKLLIHGKSFCQDGWNNKYLLTVLSGPNAVAFGL